MSALRSHWRLLALVAAERVTEPVRCFRCCGGTPRPSPGRSNNANVDRHYASLASGTGKVRSEWLSSHRAQLLQCCASRYRLNSLHPHMA